MVTGERLKAGASEYLEIFSMVLERRWLSSYCRYIPHLDTHVSNVNNRCPPQSAMASLGRVSVVSSTSRLLHAYVYHYPRFFALCKVSEASTDFKSWVLTCTASLMWNVRKCGIKLLFKFIIIKLVESLGTLCSSACYSCIPLLTLKSESNPMKHSGTLITYSFHFSSACTLMQLDVSYEIQLTPSLRSLDQNSGTTASVMRDGVGNL